MDEDMLARLEAELDRIDASLRAAKKILRQMTNQPRLALQEEPKRRTIAHPLPKEWAVSDEERAWAGRRYPRVNVDDEGEKFRSYWLGRGTKRLDWDQCFRTWVARCDQYPQARSPDKPRGSDGGTAALGQANRAKTDGALAKLSEIQSRKAGR